MTDTHALSGLPGSVTGLTLDLTSLAQTVCLAASLPHTGQGDGRAMVLACWEELTGLTGDAAIEVARAITRHPLPVTAGVIPF